MPNTLTRRGLGRALVAGCVVISGTARAASLPMPKGKVILSISGKISVSNRGSAAVFDMEMLEAIAQAGFTTSTPWYDQPAKFEGVRLDALLKTVGATGEELTALALNDYRTKIPIDDFTKYNVILACKRDGQYMPVSDKGPLFIVYPYDSDPALKHQRYYSRSAWQVSELIVK